MPDWNRLRLHLTEHLELVYYDRPLLLLLADDDGGLWLAAFIAEDNEDDMWLFTGVSRENCARLLAGEVDVLSLIERADPGERHTAMLGFKGESRTEYRACITQPLPDLAPIRERLPLPGLTFEADEFPEYLANLRKALDSAAPGA